MMDKVFIIAEAGVNHNGSLELAMRLADAAAAAGADVVKFQTFKAANIVTKDASKADYQKETTGEGSSQYEMLRKLELSPSDHETLIEHCRRIGIRFWSTAFDLESVDFLHSLGLGLWKIPSGEITNYPYLRKIAGLNEQVIMSTGMSTEEDIRNALDALACNGQDLDKVILMHCNTQYPTPMEDVNLRAMDTMREKFGLPVGYSDHTQGIEVPVAAVARGAVAIEKHFTLDRNMEGPDHKASLDPEELKDMVTAVRNIEKALGSGEKRVSDSEAGNIAVARKSIVAARPIAKGETFAEDNLTVKRPGTGISPMRWEEIIGERAIRDFKEDELIEI